MVYDLLQIHWPHALPRGVTFKDFKDEHFLGYSKERIADTRKVSCYLYNLFRTRKCCGVVYAWWMRECIRGWRSALLRGWPRALGVSNLTIKKTENLLKTAKITPAVNQGKLYACHLTAVLRMGRTWPDTLTTIWCKSLVTNQAYQKIEFDKLIEFLLHKNNFGIVTLDHAL